MVSVYKLKPWFRSKLAGICRVLRTVGATPNEITSMTCVFSLIYGALFYTNSVGSDIFEYLLIFFPIFLLIRMALNAIDGLMAVTYGMQSKSGMYLNEIGDIVSDIATYGGLLYAIGSRGMVGSFLVFLALSLCIIIVEFSGICGWKLPLKNRNYSGPFGKSDRALFFGIISLLLYLNPQYLKSALFQNIGVGLFLSLSFVTFVNRIRTSLKPSKE